MKAMVYRGPYEVRVEDTRNPMIQHPHDAIVRIATASSCGSVRILRRLVRKRTRPVGPS